MNHAPKPKNVSSHLIIGSGYNERSFMQGFIAGVPCLTRKSGTLEEKCRGFAAAQHSKLREKPVHLRSHLSQ
ncbi:unnamed protein product [Prunus brigantina]